MALLAKDPIKRLLHASDLHVSGDRKGAEREYRALLYEYPNEPETMRLLAVCLSEQGNPYEAVGYAIDACNAAPSYPEAYATAAACLDGAGQCEKALWYVDRCVELAQMYEPEKAMFIAATARFTRAMCLLKMGDYHRGFREYEAGRYIGRRQGPMGENRTSAMEKWRGDRLLGTDVLCVVWEQGYGDTIIMARFLREVKNRAGCRVIFAVQEALVPLMKYLDGPDEVVRATKGDTLPPHTHFCNAMSLPHLLGIDLADVPKYSKPYFPSVGVVKHEGPICIGVCWQGAGDYSDMTQKSMPKETMFQLQIQNPEKKVYSLQYGDSVHFPMGNFADTAEAIDGMDVVVTVCTSIAHLAGAMGKRTIVCLPHTAYWLWGLGDTTPWYENTTLVRQEKPGQWQPVMERVCELLS